MLTPEEWEDSTDLFDGFVDIGRSDGIVDVWLGGPDGARDFARERHALAALLLDGQPGGFTWAMVEAIRVAVRDAEWSEGLDADPDALQDAADRIAALLRPRTPQLPR